VRERHLSQVCCRVLIVKKAAASEDEQVELSDFRARLLACHLAHGDCTIHRVTCKRIRRIACEDGDRARLERAAQLRKQALQNGLVTEVDAAVRARNADMQAAHGIRRHDSGIASGKRRFPYCWALMLDAGLLRRP